MMSTRWPKGLLTALVTPLTGDELDLAALQRTVQRQRAAGVRAVVVGGGTGEFGVLSLDERRTLAREVVRSAGDLPVVVQTGALATRDALALSADAQAAGAAALMVASPFGEPISWSERLHFYRRLDAGVSIPVMIYNTGPAGLLTLEQIIELAELEHVSAIKDSSGNAELMGDLLHWSRDRDFTVYVGIDSLMHDALAAGADGAVFGSGNLVPDVLGALADHLLSRGATAHSRALWYPVRNMLRLLERSPNYVSLVKAGCALAGIDAGRVREPFLMPDPAEVTELAQHMKTVRSAFDDFAAAIGSVR